MEEGGHEGGRRVGQHCIWFEAPDLVHHHFVGDLKAQELRDLLRVQAGFMSGRRYGLVLADHTSLGATDTGVIGVLREDTTPGTLYATAVVGATFHTALLAELSIRAANVFRAARIHLRFFPDEASARAWLYEMRATLGGDGGP